MTIYALTEEPHQLLFDSQYVVAPQSYKYMALSLVCKALEVP